MILGYNRARTNSRRGRNNLKTYVILRNRVQVGTSAGKNSKSAISGFCNQHGIMYTPIGSVGPCGNLTKFCAVNPRTGLRPCRSRAKCYPTFVVKTQVGIMTAVPVGQR